MLRKKPLKRGNAPLRKTPLKAKRSLQRQNALKTKAILRRVTPLKPTGKRHARRASFMSHCRAAVMRRAAVVLRIIDGEPIYLRCEECQAVLPAEEAEWHHAFGRTLGVDSSHSKWVHVKELGFALCRADHERVTNPIQPRDHEARERLQRLAALRLGERLGTTRVTVFKAFATASPKAFVHVIVQAQQGQPTEP